MKKKVYGYLFVKANDDIYPVQFFKGEEVNDKEEILNIIKQMKKMSEITGYIYTLI